MEIVLFIIYHIRAKSQDEFAQKISFFSAEYNGQTNIFISAMVLAGFPIGEVVNKFFLVDSPLRLLPPPPSA